MIISVSEIFFTTHFSHETQFSAPRCRMTSKNVVRAPRNQDDLTSYKKLNFLLQAANLVDSVPLARFYAYTSKKLQTKTVIRAYVSLLFRNV